MRTKLSQLPFVRIFIPFAIGIIIELNYPLHHCLIYLGLFSLCLLLLWNRQKKVKSGQYSLRWISGLLIFITLFAFGYCTSLLRTPSENKNYVGNIKGNGRDSLIVTLTSIPQEKQRTIKATGEITGVFKNGLVTKANSQALFYFQKNSISENLNYGDKLCVYSNLQEIEPPSNPDEFDYKQYLQLHGINYECYTPGKDYILSGTNESNSLLQFVNNSRKKLVSLLNEKIGGKEAEIASAILLGYREDLSQPLTQSFIDSGVIHVICVAGLHVGILFIILNYIIIFPVKLKYGNQLSLLIILLLLWLYALFTGLATPVLRATIMFSFLTVGRHFRKYTNTVNTLAASAFLMLLFDPFSIADSSFQLSYLAVFGIIIIYKPLQSVFKPSTLFVRRIWELICVSVSAQLAVLPLSLLYFHQFSNYFILANILVVPLLAVVICTGIFFFLTSWIPYLSFASAWLLQKSLLLMNTIVAGVSHLPFSVSKGISISNFKVILLFLCITCFVTFFFSKRYNLLFSGLAVFTVFIAYKAIEKTAHLHQQILAVYNIPGKSAISFISGESCLLPFGKIDSADIAFHIQYNWWKLGIKNYRTIYSDTNATLFSGKLMLQKQFAQFNNQRVAFIRQNTDVPSSSANKLHLHCIIVSGRYDLDMLSLKNAFNFDTLIFDSSVPDYKLKKWEKECQQLNLPYYSIKTQGAYIENC